MIGTIVARSAHQGAKAARPLSPHLTIYKFGTNMNTSILFRATGAVLGFGVMAIGVNQVLGLYPLKKLVKDLQHHPIINGVVKFGVSFCLSYHFFGGLRHIGWDHLIAHNFKAVNQSGIAAFTAATLFGVGSLLTARKTEEIQ